ncbi:cobalamin (vitamin B12) biosynthesis CbiM protein [Thioploca ingrica]|uniref:Cobalamin (Vitamin B12) biosynthesis CbiM protein n=1 Tax=Thioploca ingrica TaxID=40754 RepID=A0A090AHP9_9GAMM|nr:cobalamin (vitamin B12) biosynthesis CbiM protein [Thioploca ingrica]
MHIPDAMLHGAICPVTAAVSVLGVAGASYIAVKSPTKPTATQFGAVSALIFAGQMMNFPIADGTSGHLLGGVLASALMGYPFGILALALVVTIQSLVFSDGGLSVLGANILNMALIGAGLGGIIHATLIKKSTSIGFNYFSLGIAAWISVLLAAVAVSFELAISGTITFTKVITAMLSTHMLIGLGEALITVSGCWLLVRNNNVESHNWNIITPLMASMIIALMLSPFASGFPDGLEWVAAKYQFLHQSAPTFVAPLANYTVPWLNNEIFSMGIAGLMGVLVTFSIAWLIGSLINPSSMRKLA